MANFRQGFYEVKNSEKYVGNGKPKFRSGWEMTFMMFCDNNKSVLRNTQFFAGTKKGDIDDFPLTNNQRQFPRALAFTLDCMRKPPTQKTQ